MSQTTPTSSGNLLRRAIGLAVLAVAAVLFATTMCPGAYPGDSARLVVEQCGLDAFPALSHPIYGLMARAFADLPGGSLALRLNVVSVVFSAIAVWLVYLLTSRIQHNRTFEETMARFNAAHVQIISGAVAALYTAVSLPFWLAATRAHLAPMHLCILLSAAWLLMEYAQKARLKWLYAAVFVYALGATDFATMLLLAPVFGAIALFTMFRLGHLTVRNIVTVIVCGLVGFTPYVIGVMHYMHQEAYQWRKFTSAWTVLYFLLFDQYALIARGLPRMGWLTVGVVSALPWLAVIGFRFQKDGVRTRGVWFGSFLLNALLLGLSGVILANGLISPWHLTGVRPLLVTPYILVAMWTGYVVGYWYVIATRHLWTDKKDKPLPAYRRMLAGAWLIAVACGLAYAGWRNRPAVDGRVVQPVQQFAAETVELLGNREFLLSATPLDDLFVIAAHDRGHRLRVINHDFATTASYLNYVASLFPKDPRLQGLAHVGLTPLLTEWLQGDAAARDRLGVFSAADVWYSSGLEPIPDRAFFRGGPRDAHPDMQALFAEHQVFWTRMEPLLKTDQLRKDSPVRPWLAFVARHLAKVANNLGVLLEEQKRSDLAFDAYAQARRFDTNNLSALLNIYSLCKREERPELTHFDAALKALPANTRFEYWALSYHFGYVRTPEAYAARGWAWAVSGKPNLAAEDMQSALQMGTNTANLRLAMANMFFESQPGEAEKSLLDVLRQKPNDQTALLGLARVSMRKSDFDSARQYLGRLRELGANEAAVAIEEAIVESFAGRSKEAKARLQAVLKKTPSNQRALTFLALLAAQENDEKTVEDCMRLMKTGRGAPPPVLLAVAHLAMQRRDWVNARKHFQQYLYLRPADKNALEQLLQLDRIAGDRESAERHVDALLSLDPKNALGNFVLGHLQNARGDFALAEASLRASLEVQRQPDTLNELAWLLANRGRLEEAEKLARECVQMAPKHQEGWDTLGYTLLQLGRFDDAESALHTALQITPDDAELRLHVLLVMEKKGQREAALKIAEDLLTRPGAMDKAAYEQLRETAQRLRRGV